MTGESVVYNLKILFCKLRESVLTGGVVSTALNVVKFPINKLKHRSFRRKVLSMNSIESRFTWIYNKNYWSSNESLSGTGSTLKCTENLRKELPKLFAQFSINTVFDAPCGDFNWMRHFLPCVDVQYIGGDIVKPLIEKLNENFKSSKASFVHFDLINNIPPQVDLMICRDCLFHFSFEDAKAVLGNFIKSNSKYFLTTTHKNTNSLFKNRDISTGDFRRIYLFLPPYNFPCDPLYTIDDWMAPEPERQMCLWSREQIISASNIFKS